MNPFELFRSMFASCGNAYYIAIKAYVYSICNYDIHSKEGQFKNWPHWSKIQKKNKNCSLKVGIICVLLK